MSAFVAAVFLVCATALILATVFYDPICDRIRGRREDMDGMGRWDDEEVGL